MTELEKATDFQTRMFERIREQMGDLLTEVELKQIVEKALDKAFTDDVRVLVTHSRYGYNQTEEATVKAPFIGMVQVLLRPLVEKAVKEWCDAHPDEIEQAINDALRGGIAKMVVQYFENKLSGPINELRYKMEQALTPLQR